MSVKRISLISIPKAGKTALFLGASLMGWASGLMILSKLARLIQDISKQTDMVYFCIAEHLPWDAINLLGLRSHLSAGVIEVGLPIPEVPGLVVANLDHFHVIKS